MPRFARLLFICFAPITLPLYVVWLALMTLLAGSYYITVELTLSPLLGRPLALRGPAFWMLGIAAVLLMPLCMTAHVFVWLVKQCIGICTTLGRWQTGLHHAGATAPLGAFWLAAAAWCLVTSIDPQGGLNLIGRPVPGAAEFDRAIRRRLTLGQLSPAAQENRARLIASLESGVNTNIRAETREWLLEALRDDNELFERVQYLLRNYIVGMPAFFRPGVMSDDGTDRGLPFIGALLLGVLLLPRWPGLHGPKIPRGVCLLLYLVRTGASLAAVIGSLAWCPLALSGPDPRDASLFWRLLQPAVFLRADPMLYPQPDWLALNAGLWLLLIGLAAVIWTVARRIAPLLGSPGYYTAYLAVRLLQRKRIAFFSIGAVTLCVAMELIVISVMGGFLDTIRTRSRGLVGDLLMEGGMTGFPRYAEFLDEVRRWPEIRAATPMIRAYGLLRFPDTNYTKPVEVRGIYLSEYRRVNSFGDPETLFYDTNYPGTTTFAPASQPMAGWDKSSTRPLLPEPFESAWQKRLASLPPEKRAAEAERFERLPTADFPGPGVFAVGTEEAPSMQGRALPGIIIGREVIARRRASGEYERSHRYPRGLVCQLSLMPLTRRGQISSESPPAPYFRYVDDARTGVFEIDSRTAYVDLDYLQTLLSMSPQKKADGSGLTPPRCSAVLFKLSSGADVYEMRERIEKAWDEFVSQRSEDVDDLAAMRNVTVATWEELQRDFIAAIQKEKVLTVTMFGIISIVAILLVLCIFYMIVVEKTRDIGILKAIGGSAHGVAAVFLIYGAAIGVVGAALGSWLGATFVHHINDVQDWLARMNPEWRVWSPETYSFDKIPDTVKVEEMLWIAALAVLASILGAVAPAIRAAKTWPVQALRYE